MSISKIERWERYQTYLCRNDEIGLQLDISRMNFQPDLFDRNAERINNALDAMIALEQGAKANVDEHRMVGHYWLRNSAIAPFSEISNDIEQSIAQIKSFVQEVHNSSIKPPDEESFMIVLAIGIGGSALGPQLLTSALGTSDDLMLINFIDNTDPDGIARVLDELEAMLGQVLVVVSSKSGGTIETRNAMLEVANAFSRANLDFAKHAVAITCKDSQLDQLAKNDGWLGVFAIWDWVGGRTSITSAVGLLPAALSGIEIDEFLAGARKADVVTRSRDIMHNPAALLALMWDHACRHQNKRNMVILPYADHLSLFGNYMQQLTMESIGKATNRAGELVNEGLAVFGNKGTTDQHSILQQLQEGPNDFFAMFIQVQKHTAKTSANVDPELTSGDFLNSFLLATRESLYEANRESITISVDELTPHSLGALVAIFERAVSLYAELLDINAYHQPGVEASKRAVAMLADWQRKAMAHLHANPNQPLTAKQIAKAIGEADEIESVYSVLSHVAANNRHKINVDRKPTLDETTFSVSAS